MSLLNLTLREVASRLRDGKVVPTELCEKCIRRVQRTSHLNAFITRTHGLARRDASISNYRYIEGKPLGVLDGVPIAIKDNYCTRSIPTTCASAMLKSFIPTYNATMVQKQINKGAILVGKTNMDEFAMGSGSVDGIYGPVRNPWCYNFSKVNLENYSSKETLQEHHHSSPSELYQSISVQSESDKQRLTEDQDWHISGGSSGGSAVAVAIGACYAALGSDTGGSVRIPASYCGVVGLKPSYGLLSRHGLIPLVNSLDVPGIFTKSVDDSAMMINLLMGHDVSDSTTIQEAIPAISLPDDVDIKGLCIGIPKEYHAPLLSKEVLLAWKQAADAFDDAGAKVVEVSMPHTQYSILCYYMVCNSEVASNMARYDGIEYGHRCDVNESTEELYAATRHEGFNNVVRGRILAGNYFLLKQNYDKYFLHAQRVRRLIANDFREVYSQGIDVLLTPTTLSEAPTFSWFTGTDSRSRSEEQDIFTQPANMAGVPAISLPVGLSSNNLPISLQIIGQNFKEQNLLEAAKWYEKQVNFSQLDLSSLDEDGS